MNSCVIDNEGVGLNCTVVGSGPPIILLHGIPDFSGGWHYQIDALSASHQLIIPDLRGFNKSDKPVGRGNYLMSVLVSDIAAIIDHFKFGKVGIVGHDMGGAIAWWAAIMLPGHINRLAVLSAAHPVPYLAALRKGGEQPQRLLRTIKAYLEMAQAGALNAQQLSSWVEDVELCQRLRQALEQTDANAVVDYYLANQESTQSLQLDSVPKVQCPTMTIRGQNDQYVAPGLFDTVWKHINAETCTVSLPHAGHFIHHQAAPIVNRHLKNWFAIE